MYGWLWRHLPGPVWVRVLTCALLAAVAVLLCMTVLFPAVAPLLEINDGTVGS